MAFIAFCVLYRQRYLEYAHNRLADARQADTVVSLAFAELADQWDQALRQPAHQRLRLAAAQPPHPRPRAPSRGRARRAPGRREPRRTRGPRLPPGPHGRHPRPPPGPGHAAAGGHRDDGAHRSPAPLNRREADAPSLPPCAPVCRPRAGSHLRGGGRMHGPHTVGWLLTALCAVTGITCLLRARGAGPGAAGRRRGARPRWGWGWRRWQHRPPGAEHPRGTRCRDGSSAHCSAQCWCGSCG